MWKRTKKYVGQSESTQRPEEGVTEDDEKLSVGDFCMSVLERKTVK